MIPLSTIPAGALMAALTPLAIWWWTRGRDGPFPRPGHLLQVAVTVPVVVSFAVFAASSPEERSDFTLDGLAKKFAIPLIVGLLMPVIVVLWRRRRAWASPQVMDAVIAFLAASSALGAAVGLLRGNELLDVAQDLGLAALFIACYLAGRLMPAEAAAEAGPGLLKALVVVAALSVLLDPFISTLPSLQMAVGFAAVAFSLTNGGQRLWGLLGLGIIAGSILGLSVQDPLTQYFQLALGACVLVYLLLLRRWRVPAAAVWLVLAAGAAVLFVLVPRVESLVTLEYRGKDVSFGQRVYEARKVRDSVDGSVGNAALGRGLGATVDLRRSPDAVTLRNAGRDLRRVDDVHLLPYDVVLKRGLIGLAWLVAFVLALAQLVPRAAGQAQGGERRTPMAYLMLIPLLGLVDAPPAASHIFANPLGPLCLGLVVAAQVAAPHPRREAAAWLHPLRRVGVAR